MLKNDFLVPPLSHPPISETLFITFVDVLHRRGGPPCLKFHLGLQADDTTQTPWGCGEITHMWRFLGRGGRVARSSESGLREQGKDTCLTFIRGDWGGELGWATLRAACDCHGWNFPPAPGNGAPGLSYRLAQMQNRGKRGQGEWGLDSYQQWNVTEEIRVLVIEPNPVPIAANGSSILSAE